MNRRSLLAALPLLAGGCSILPDRPNVPVRRYALAPMRPENQASRPRAPVLQVRLVRAVPGLQDLGLRRLNADGSYEILVYEEWLAPPALLTDAALRAWLQASGLFSAVVPQGSRAEADLVLEMQLTQLEAVPAAGRARAALSGLLLREERLTSRVVETLEVSAEAPLAPDAEAPAMARSMALALGLALSRLEAALVPLAR
ncbi:ABC-type transport auxiliary lipoprotein family protein [Falsiroseomonas tokyonensis]|uniref:ABC-type transport auxiliary lipoprotein family protein n=1 Tax=Falsiroseomonas tokyonensis TaxID=430521 RepID=A0ABV7BNZ6_9PROT|nr:ABC-type transport auxiliary lipoprotein family protein [Falsiroseomonas tokyonensis]MBU8536390.1 membrane integrity-associated transporter subunit PqiC [Falsiroseomonas tokyonensis]